MVVWNSGKVLLFMRIKVSSMQDFQGWVALAGAVEHLFGPMVDEPAFHEALQQAIGEKRAFCVADEGQVHGVALFGGIVISTEMNEIVWLAVSGKARGNGYGKALLEYALARLDGKRIISVQTFDSTVPEGLPARKLYESLGFRDHLPGGLNPAGIPTVIMHRDPSTRYY
jgi:ribosomal protein S18 acetylase RimI-like enzyme